MNPLRLIALLSLPVFALSACKTVDGLMSDVDSLDLGSALAMNESTAEGLTYDSGCPKVEVVPELRYYNDFADDGSTRPDLLVSQARIADFQTACSFDERSLSVDLKMRFDGALGPHGRMGSGDKPFYSYPFFVAVTDADGHILTKEVYAASMTYPPSTSTNSYNENMRFILPMETRDHGARQKILLGFQLSPDQLAYNRTLLKQEQEQREKEQIKDMKALPEKQPQTPPPQDLVIDAQPLEDQKTVSAQDKDAQLYRRR